MTDNAPSTGRRVAKAAGQFLVIAIVVNAVIYLVAPRVDLPDVDLPSISMPDSPGWLAFLLGPGKLIVLFVILMLVAIADGERRKRRDDEGES